MYLFINYNVHMLHKKETNMAIVLQARTIGSLSATATKILSSCNMTLSSLVNRSQYFRERYCIYFQCKKLF